MRAVLVSDSLLPDVPSGSGIEIVHDSLYLISDDAPYFYQLSGSTASVRSFAIHGLPLDRGRLPKPEKPDFEAVFTAHLRGQDQLVAFGSGSLAQTRETYVVFPLPLRDTPYQSGGTLNALYWEMRKEAGISVQDFNIEAAAVINDRLLLFNRGTNHVFFIKMSEMNTHLSSASRPPAVRSVKLELPSNGPYPLGISGASVLDGNRVLFCASVEATTDWTKDGAVLGSSIGVLEMVGADSCRLLSLAPLLTPGGDTVKHKLEGIFPAGKITNGTQEVLGIVDNDNGSSRLLRIRLEKMP